MTFRIAVFVAIVVLLAGVAGADTLYLKNGGKFTGRVVKETSTTVEFEIRGIGAQVFQKKEILKIEKGASIFDEYDKKKAETSTKDAAALFELGKWCVDNRLRKEAKSAFRAVIKLSPDHESARAALGFVRVQGKWLSSKAFRKYQARRKKELEAVLGTLALGDPHRDDQVTVTLRPPKGWKDVAAGGGAGVEFGGPELHGVRLTIGYEVEETTDLAAFKSIVLRDLKSEHEDLEEVKADRLTDLAGKVAKESVYRYGPDGKRAERHDVFCTRKSDIVHVWYVCPADDVDALSGLFSEVRASFMLEKVVEKARPGEIAFELPDTDWRRGFGAIAAQPGFSPPNFGDEFKVIGHSINYTFILMGSQEVDGDPNAALSQFRRQAWADGDMRLRPSRDKEWSRKVSGQDALVTPYTGSLGGAVAMDGFLCTFVKGKRIYIVMAMNLLGSMGEKYLKKDLNKLLDTLTAG
jgi:hypothetical protein